MNFSFSEEHDLADFNLRNVPIWNRKITLLNPAGSENSGKQLQHWDNLLGDMFRTLDSPLSASIIDVCAKIFRNMTLHHSETEKGKNPWLDVTSSVSNIRRISRSFLKKRRWWKMNFSCREERDLADFEFRNGSSWNRKITLSNREGSENSGKRLQH